jgi:hypothetical protein
MKKMVNFFMLLEIFENEFVKCELDDSLPVLRHRWKVSPPSEEFKANLHRILAEFKALYLSYESLAWLAHTTLLGELDEEAERWLVEEWEDLLFARAKVKIHAVILGNSIFADYPMEKFKNDAEQKFKDFDVNLGVFSNQSEAYEWIQELQMEFED